MTAATQTLIAPNLGLHFRRSPDIPHRPLSPPPPPLRCRNLAASKKLRSSARESYFMELPLLPFQPDEVLVPSECKTLHLYEARFLALLEESLDRREKFFVHLVLHPILGSRSARGASFAARYGCLVCIENVERLDIGALVSIRGIGRVSVTKLQQMEPYLRGLVVPLRDNVPNCESEKFVTQPSKDEPLQTPHQNSLKWAEREIVDCNKAFIPEVAERLSFAALQPVVGSTASELLELQREKMFAMDSKNTYERLTIVTDSIKQKIALVAAKLAIQSLEL
ncbi:hypothetical protein QJS10_CPB13g00882 [Acorus calamus]|uniref:Lon N-terminal domain-containing protein n=1 Tax=Acorus calamus TaxID=4465 RepID=A0AAV9DHD1_ACOCL|nr:hypothetical protein QJS10_CPB13g00882 [Acorus calamus]